MKCGQDNCKKKATHLMHWPRNTPKFICNEHRDKIEQVVNEWKLDLHLEKIK